MREPLIRALGLLAALTYAALIGLLLVWQPRTMAEATGGLAASIGAYRIDEQALQDGLRFFRNDQFPESRAAFARADPAGRDARAQFYIAYSFYRQGWGRMYRDDVLFRQGLDAVTAATALAPGGRLVIEDDADLQMKSADELKAELEKGLARDASDFNPLRVFDTRK